MRYTTVNVLVATTAVAVCVALVLHGVRVGGAGGGIICGTAAGIALAFFGGAYLCLRSHWHIAALLLILASMGTATIGYHSLGFHALFAAPDHRLTRNFQHLSIELKQHDVFENVEARMQHEAIGGCVILTGAVDSQEELEHLISICDTYGRNAIENRVSVRHEMQ